jgi:PTH1 family peptidyl-tRNA hydrolase
MLFLDRVLAGRNLVWTKQTLGQVCRTRIESRECLLFKPKTFMNCSGNPVSKLMNQFGIKTEDLVVCHDDLEKALGRANLKIGGSANGHNGVKSIISRIGPDFTRLRLGIGRPADKAQVAEYVLEPFEIQEQFELERSFELGQELLLKTLRN